MKKIKRQLFFFGNYLNLKQGVVHGMACMARI